MTDNLPPLLRQTRRHFFHNCAVGLGAMALGSLLRQEGAVAAPSFGGPLDPKPTHYAPRAKSVIFLFMAGGPSQPELFDYKPQLQALHGQPIPESFIKGKRFAFMDSFAKDPPKLLATKRKFARHGKSGAWVSDSLPYTAQVADDIAIVRSVQTNV